MISVNSIYSQMSNGDTFMFVDDKDGATSKLWGQVYLNDWGNVHLHYLIIFIYILFLPWMFLLPENARKFLGKMQPSGNMKFTNLKKLDSLK